MKEYNQPKHRHMLPYYCWCADNDNRFHITFYPHKDKKNRKIYKKRARRKAKNIIKEQLQE